MCSERSHKWFSNKSRSRMRSLRTIHKMSWNRRRCCRDSRKEWITNYRRISGRNKSYRLRVCWMSLLISWYRRRVATIVTVTIISRWEMVWVKSDHNNQSTYCMNDHSLFSVYISLLLLLFLVIWNLYQSLVCFFSNKISTTTSIINISVSQHHSYL